MFETSPQQLDRLGISIPKPIKVNYNFDFKNVEY